MKGLVTIVLVGIAVASEPTETPVPAPPHEPTPDHCTFTCTGEGCPTPDHGTLAIGEFGHCTQDTVLLDADTGKCHADGAAVAYQCGPFNNRIFIADLSQLVDEDSITTFLKEVGVQAGGQLANSKMPGIYQCPVECENMKASVCKNKIYFCTACLACETAPTTSTSTRSSHGRVAIICHGTPEEQHACFQEAACDGAILPGQECVIGGEDVLCPTCPDGGSKKGLLGLLGLLGLIPLLLCVLLSAVLVCCLLRRKKVEKDVHFATFDPHAASMHIEHGYPAVPSVGAHCFAPTVATPSF